MVDEEPRRHIATKAFGVLHLARAMRSLMSRRCTAQHAAVESEPKLSDLAGVGGAKSMRITAGVLVAAEPSRLDGRAALAGVPPA